MGTILVAALLSLVFVYAIYSYVRKLRQGGGCCGGHEPAEKKVKVADRDKRHYPYTVTLTVDGMTCGNCVRRVENALNRLDGVWAEVDLGAHRTAPGRGGSASGGARRGLSGALGGTSGLNRGPRIGSGPDSGSTVPEHRVQAHKSNRVGRRKKEERI